jgi:ubiquinone/menaquinone biosynthesis C-methylase UbiE
MNFKREQDRLDFQDAIIKALTNTINHPQLDHPGRILDVGTGTGIWAEDIGERTIHCNYLKPKIG